MQGADRQPPTPLRGMFEEIAYWAGTWCSFLFCATGERGNPPRMGGRVVEGTGLEMRLLLVFWCFFTLPRPYY